jgi:hypothetical protein
MAILADLNKLSSEQLVAIILQQQEAAKAKITFRVNDKPVTDPKTKETKPGSRSLSIFGIGRFPPTLYASQWLRILDAAEQLRAFIAANHSSLAWKE